MCQSSRVGNAETPFSVGYGEFINQCMRRRVREEKCFGPYGCRIVPSTGDKFFYSTGICRDHVYPHIEIFILSDFCVGG